MQVDSGVDTAGGARALDEGEAHLLEAYGVPLAPWSTASDARAAAVSAGRLGFPVAAGGSGTGAHGPVRGTPGPGKRRRAVGGGQDAA